MDYNYILPISLFSSVSLPNSSQDSTSKPRVKPVPVTVTVTTETLLDGLGRLLQFLFESEADYLCGVPLHMRSSKRTNYRIGHYTRNFRTHLGTISIRIPHLLYFHHRIPIVKRANRLSAGILESLARIHADGATFENAAALIKELWTVELSGELLETLGEKLALVLNAWRNGDGYYKFGS